MSDAKSPGETSTVIEERSDGPGSRRVWAWTAFEIVVVLVCGLVVCFQRLLELEQVEIGGDALKVWEFARNLVLGGEFPSKLNHHTTRFGLVLPTMVVQWLFGAQATSYFIGPIAASVLLHLWVYLIARKLSGPFAGAVGVVALLNFDPMVRASSQILPEAFGPMYAAFATYAALLFTDAKTLWGRWLALGATGLGLMFAYGAKEIFLFYAPGVAVLVWFGGSQGPLLPQAWVDAPAPGGDAGVLRRLLYWARGSKLLIPAALTGLVLLLVLLETILLVGVADAGSRLDVVQSSHGGGGARGPRITEAGDFFALYTRAPAEWIQALTAAAIAWLGVTAFARDRRSKLVGLTLLIFFLLQTFIVRKLDPLTPWFKPHPRYLLGMVGPIAMILGIFAGDALRSIFARPTLGRETGRFLSLSAALCLFWMAGKDLPRAYQATWGKGAAWVATQAMTKELTAAYVAGIPIVADTPLGKPAIAAASLFIDPAVLLDEDGKIIKTEEILGSTNKKGRFVASAARTRGIKKSRLRNVVERRALERRCAVVLRQSVRFISGSMSFAQGCISLEDEFAKDPHAGEQAPRANRPSRNRGSRGRSPRRAP